MREAEARRDGERARRRRTIFWIVFIVFGLVLGIAGLSKVAQLIGTDPPKRPISK